MGATNFSIYIVKNPIKKGKANVFKAYTNNKFKCLRVCKASLFTTTERKYAETKAETKPKNNAINEYLLKNNPANPKYKTLIIINIIIAIKRLLLPNKSLFMIIFYFEAKMHDISLLKK